MRFHAQAARLPYRCPIDCSKSLPLAEVRASVRRRPKTNLHWRSTFSTEQCRSSSSTNYFQLISAIPSSAVNLCSTPIRPRNSPHHGGQDGAVQVGGAWRWRRWEDGFDDTINLTTFRGDCEHLLYATSLRSSIGMFAVFGACC